MTNKKFKTREEQKSFAIVTTLIISSIVLIIVGSLFYKFSLNGKDLAADTNRKTALNIAEEGSYVTLNYVSYLNNPTGKSDTDRIALARKAGTEFVINNTTPDNLFPGYVRSQSGAKNGYAKFKSSTGKGEFEIKTYFINGDSTTGSNNMKADIISYVPSKESAVVVRDFNLKFKRTFPPISTTGAITTASTPVPTAIPLRMPIPNVGYNAFIQAGHTTICHDPSGDGHNYITITPSNNGVFNGHVHHATDFLGPCPTPVPTQTPTLPSMPTIAGFGVEVESWTEVLAG